MTIKPTLITAILLMIACLNGKSEPPVSLAFSNVDRMAREGKSLNVVFFGGSLTWGSQSTDPQLTSYRARMAEKFAALYPKAHFRFWDGSIGGTGSQLGAFRLERDVLARKPDLVFLDFTINDDAFSQADPDRLASYESIVRKLVQAGVPVVQVIFAVKKDLMPQPPARPLDAEHKKIAHAYHLPVADAVVYMREQVKQGSAEPDKLWTAVGDETHPGDGGYALYAEAVWDTYRQAVKEDARCSFPAQMLNADTYMKLNRQRISKLLPLPSGWEVGMPNRQAITYDFIPSRWLDDVTVARISGKNNVTPEPLRMKIRARNILVFGESTPSSGSFNVTIDGGVSKSYPVGGDLACNGNLRYVQMIAQGLDAKKDHIVEIAPQLEMGQELRFESLCVAGGQAAISPIK